MQRSQEQSRETRRLVPGVIAAPERDARIVKQRNRLTGLRFKGEHASYDLALAVLEKDCLTYLGPEKFPTRRNELMQKKPSKEISIDQSQLVVKDKQPELTCPTVTELEIANAFKRRALAFDLAGASTYDTMAAYHADLMDHLHLPAPPGYLDIHQFQCIKFSEQTEAFLFRSEKMNTLKRSASGALPLDVLLPSILNQPTVAFHLLPLAGSSNKASSSTKTPATERKRSRAPTRHQPKNKGRGKGKSKKGRGPNVPSALIGKAFETPQKKRLCWAFNLPNGCSAAKPGETCSKGLHVCAEPGCFKHHSPQQHR